MNDSDLVRFLDAQDQIYAQVRGRHGCDPSQISC